MRSLTVRARLRRVVVGAAAAAYATFVEALDVLAACRSSGPPISGPTDQPLKESNALRVAPRRSSIGHYGSATWAGTSRTNGIGCVTVLAVCVVSSAGCSRQHLLSPVAVDHAAMALSLTKDERRPVRLYFDASGSMRGFGLAAATNIAGASDAFGSLLDGVRTLIRENPETGPSVPAALSNVQLFGSKLNGQPSFDPIADAALGRRPPPSDVTSSVLRSANCAGATWNGAVVSREHIDRVFGEATTCLDTVFQDVMANGRERLNVLVTDAEQNAPLNDRGCPNAQNAGTIQSHLAEWSRLGGVAAVIAMKLPYQAWQSRDTAGFCQCGERLLFVYVLAPYSGDLDRVLTHVREAWKGAGEPLYIPLNPRPAVAYTVRVVSDSEPGSSVDFATGAVRTQLEPSQRGRLPQVWMLLRGDEGRVALSLERMAFGASADSAGTSVDWSKLPLQWAAPRLLTSDGAIDNASGEGPLTFVQMNSALGNEKEPGPANVRMARFLGIEQEPESELVPAGADTLRLRIRKAVGGTGGCRWYLLEATMPGRAFSDDINRIFSSLSSNMCLNWNAVQDQVKSTLQAGPSVRLLLHIDYE
jgi:hypothetical protein